MAEIYAIRAKGMSYSNVLMLPHFESTTINFDIILTKKS